MLIANGNVYILENSESQGNINGKTIYIKTDPHGTYTNSKPPLTVVYFCLRSYPQFLLTFF